VTFYVFLLCFTRFLELCRGVDLGALIDFDLGPLMLYLESNIHNQAVSVMSVTGVLHADYNSTKLKLNSSGSVLRRSSAKFQEVS